MIHTKFKMVAMAATKLLPRLSELKLETQCSSEDVVGLLRSVLQVKISKIPSNLPEI